MNRFFQACLTLKVYAFVRVCSLLMCVVWLISCEPEPATLFTPVPSSHTSIDFVNTIEETPEKNVMVYEYYYNGGGVAAADFNNDGLCDLYFTGNAVENKLYLNRGALKFEDVTTKANVAGRDGWKTGVTAADVNGDGWLDLYVSYSGPVLKENLYDELYINQGCEAGGIPTFIEQAKSYGLESDLTFSTQATFFDYDNDGDLDMFQSNHGHRYFSPFFNTRIARSKRHPQFGNRLYRNDNGKFIEVSEEAGIHGGGLNFGLSACVSDINNDGWMDLYVTNDFEEQDYLYLNNHDRTFREVNKQATDHTSKFSMGSDIADFNNDLLPDILVVDMLPETLARQKLLKGPDEYDRYTLMVDSGFHHQNMRNTLQLNRGNAESGVPRFSEIGQLAGVYNTDWSWSALMADLDNDGYKDIFITNGFLRDFTNMDFLKYTYQEASENAMKKNTILPVYELIKKMPSTTLSNYAFQNNKDFTFSNATKKWGLELPMMSFGAVYVDLDNDGDLELVTNNTNEKASVWENKSNELLNHHFLKVKLKGAGKNTYAIGAKVVVESANLNQVQELVPSRGFQSSVDYALNFGLGANTGDTRITITWPDGRKSILDHVQVDTLITVSQEDAMVTKIVVCKDADTKLFEDHTILSGVEYWHEENAYVDFRSERLLLYQLSQDGPCLSKGDVDRNGYEDFYIGGAAGSSGKLFLQGAQGTFTKSIQKSFEADKECEDIGSLLFDVDGDGDLDLYVVSGGNEFSLGDKRLRDRFYENDGRGNFLKNEKAIPKEFASGSCVVAADYDRDGDLDLYVGGRVDPGRFPVAGLGGILRNDSDKKEGISFSVATEQVNPKLKSVGMVTDARWIDFNNDGWLDLIIVGEWMPILLFRNENGKLVEVNPDAFKESSGLWSAIEVDDFDGDGDVDFIVGNAGSNLQWTATPQKPMTMYVSDFDDNGTLDPIICTHDQGKDYPIASRDEMLEQLPSLKKKFVLYKDYSVADIGTFFSSKQLTSARKMKVQDLLSVYVENLGNNNFKIKPLPIEAQFSRINGITTGDYNLDGHRDVLITGNFFPYRVQYGKSDASVGLLLLGDGRGNFNCMNNTVSGFYASGDVRDMIELRGPAGNLIVVSKNKDKLQVIRRLN